MEFCEHVENVIAERKQQESEKRKQQEETWREKIRKKEEEIRKREEVKKREELVLDIERINGDIATAENQIESLKKLRCASVRDLRLDAYGSADEVMEDYCDSPSVMHTEQQTDINGAIIDKILEENEILKAELRRKTMNIDLICEDDELQLLQVSSLRYSA